MSLPSAEQTTQILHSSSRFWNAAEFYGFSNLLVRSTLQCTGWTAASAFVFLKG